MRTRSGLDLGNREMGKTDDMADDNRSTEARWGTPAHTASFSTIASHRRSSLSPRSTGNGQQQHHTQQITQYADDVPSNHSPNHFSVSPLGDQQRQQGQDYFNNPTTTETYYPPTTGIYQPPHSQPHHPPFFPSLQPLPPQQYYPSTTQEPESIRRYSTETGADPWSPAAPGSPPPGQGENNSLKRRFSGYDDEFGEGKIHRQYRDKIEEELESLAKDGKAEGGRDKKRKKNRRTRSSPQGKGDKGERKDKDRDDYPDKYGEGGEGMGIRA